MRCRRQMGKGAHVWFLQIKSSANEALAGRIVFTFERRSRACNGHKFAKSVTIVDLERIYKAVQHDVEL